MTEQVTYTIECSKCANLASQSQLDARSQGDSGEDENVGDVRRHLYVGQSGRTIHSRMKEHLGGLRRRDKACSIWKHQLDYHEGDRDHTNLEMRVTQPHRSNVNRLLYESHQIISFKTNSNWLVVELCT